MVTKKRLEKNLMLGFRHTARTRNNVEGDASVEITAVRLFWFRLPGVATGRGLFLDNSSNADPCQAPDKEPLDLWLQFGQRVQRQPIKPPFYWPDKFS